MTNLLCRAFCVFGHAERNIYRYFCTDLSVISFLTGKLFFYMKKLGGNVRKVFANSGYAWYTVWAIGKESKNVK